MKPCCKDFDIKPCCWCVKYDGKTSGIIQCWIEYFYDKLQELDTKEKLIKYVDNPASSFTGIEYFSLVIKEFYPEYIKILDVILLLK
jgi:hypothetical protein